MSEAGAAGESPTAGTPAGMQASPRTVEGGFKDGEMVSTPELPNIHANQPLGRQRTFSSPLIAGNIDALQDGVPSDGPAKRFSFSEAFQRTTSSSSLRFMRPHPEIFPAEKSQGVAEIVKGQGHYFDTARISASRPVSPITEAETDSWPADLQQGNFASINVADAHRGTWGPEISSDAPAVAILTSGGDAPGMNAAVRSCVATCLAKRARIFAIMNGYQGLVDGGSNIKEMQWKDIQDIMQTGGTVINSARCAGFRTREGRLQAALHLAQLGVNRLVVIGGDGSLTGANCFKIEWPSLLAELVKRRELPQDQADKVAYLCITGLVGSIDNDMCGFTMTIGCDTALHRIVDACDNLITTAKSHKRTFIVEVMGRHCGWLALMASVAVGADWVFIPECPPDVEDWESALCDGLAARRKQTNYSLVILAEGATDRVRRPIESAYLKAILSERLGHDTRVTCLGHVQRGGAPSADDRLQGTWLGAEAALAILGANDSTPSRIIGIRDHEVVSLELTAAVEKTRAVGEALQKRDFDTAMELRGPEYANLFLTFRRLRHKRVPEPEPPGPGALSCNVCIVHAGSPAAGMNAITKVVVRSLANSGHHSFGAIDGFLGLALGHLFQLNWESVAQWHAMGGCKLGTNRVVPDKINGGEGVGRIAKVLEYYKIQAIIIIGGFEGLSGLQALQEGRKKYPALCIPMTLIPATISNNLPGSKFSIGADTALNCIVDSIDRVKLSASSSRARVFLVEVMGGNCGFLAVLGALAGGADGCYIHENVVSLEEMLHDVNYFREKFSMNFKKGLIIRNECCSRLYNMPFMQSLFEQEGGRVGHMNFTVRNNVLGHLQQGNAPSPLDRCRSAVLGIAAADDAIAKIKANLKDSEETCYTDAPDTSVICGVDGEGAVFTPLADLIDTVDMENRRPKDQWWNALEPLIRLLELNNDGTWGDALLYKAQARVLSEDEM